MNTEKCGKILNMEAREIEQGKVWEKIEHGGMWEEIEHGVWRERLTKENCRDFALSTSNMTRNLRMTVTNEMKAEATKRHAC